MSKYIVNGDEGADVDVFGTIFHPGDEVDLQDDVAAPLVEAGTITLADGSASEDAPAEETPSEEAPAEDAPAEAGLG